MALTRDSVTVASRIMLPAYVVLFAGLGLNYTLTPEPRLRLTPSLDYAARLMPLSAWGWLFLIVAALMVAALLSHRRGLYRYALLLCALAMAVWAVSAALAALESSATPLGWLWPGFVVACCLASYRSLTVREV